VTAVELMIIFYMPHTNSRH